MIKKILFIIYLFSAFLQVYAQVKDIGNFKFIYIKMNYNFNETIDALKKMQKSYEIIKDRLENEITIQPKGFVYPNEKSERRDYAVTFYKNKILYFEKQSIKKEYKDYLIKNLGKYSKREENDYYRNYVWNKNNYEVILSFSKRDENDIEASTLVVKNSEVYSSYMDDYEKKYPPLYMVLKDKVKLYNEPNEDSKMIRYLIKSELVNFVEKGKETIIKNKKIQWIKIKTQKGDVGWCINSYLENMN